MLDTIALLLTTGPGEMVVAAFDRHVRLSVVLAIGRHGDGDGDVNDHPTPAHHAKIRDFTSLFTNPMIHSVDDVFPYLVKHCGSNINRWIRKLHSCLSAFTSTLDYESADDDDSFLASYRPATSLHLEFPNSERWISEHYPNANATSKSTFITILSNFISTACSTSTSKFRAHVQADKLKRRP
jgi:hypothetical protein